LPERALLRPSIDAMRASASCFVLVACCAALGCKASASASLNTSADVDTASDEAPLTESATPSSETQSTAELALLGARHDVRYSGAANATCRCLAVALGGVSDAGIGWRSQVPELDPATQLVIALSSEGVSCPDAPTDSLGASYWGYRIAGDDVIVVVESARDGRPVTAGAIIPKPMGSGRVLLEPLNARVPYGRPLSGGDKRCVLGNPGSPRPATPPSAPASEDSNDETTE
jgi:hypothetical protein